jgi:hypothetical protein
MFGAFHLGRALRVDFEGQRYSMAGVWIIQIALGEKFRDALRRASRVTLLVRIVTACHLSRICLGNDLG